MHQPEESSGTAPSVADAADDLDFSDLKKKKKKKNIPLDLVSGPDLNSHTRGPTG